MLEAPLPLKGSGWVRAVGTLGGGAASVGGEQVAGVTMVTGSVGLMSRRLGQGQ